jgi:hypothetical protein
VFAACEDFHGLLVERRLPKPDRVRDEVAEFILGETVATLRGRFGGGRIAGVPYVCTETDSAPREGLRQLLARSLQSRGIVALTPDEKDADFDLGWHCDGSWTLVNTVVLVPKAEELQLRILLGTTLRHYQRYLDQPPSLAVLTDRMPTDASWNALFADYGVHLCHQPDQLFDAVTARA